MLYLLKISSAVLPPNRFILHATIPLARTKVLAYHIHIEEGAGNALECGVVMLFFVLPRGCVPCAQIRGSNFVC